MIYEDASGHVFRRSPQHLKKPKHTWCSRCGGYVSLRELPELEQKRLRKHHGESIIQKNHKKPGAESIMGSNSTTDSHMVVGRGAPGKLGRPAHGRNNIHRRK